LYVMTLKQLSYVKTLKLLLRVYQPTAVRLARAEVAGACDFFKPIRLRVQFF
jgi:hypothetical protein